MDRTIYYIIGALIVVYLFISMTHKKKSKKRKNRKFMDGYERKGKDIE